MSIFGDQFAVIVAQWGTFWGHLGIILESCSMSFWGHLGTILGVMSAVISEAISVSLWAHSGHFWWSV